MNEFRQYFPPVWMKRRTIAIVSLIVGAIVLTLNLLLPSYYEAEGSLLPQTENRIAAMTQFADLAQLAGLQGGTREIARLYPAILQSETILAPVVSRLYDTDSFDEPVDLIRYFGIDEETDRANLADAVETLRELMSVSIDARTSIVTCTVQMREPELASSVANALIEELDLFMRVKRKTAASEQLDWITVRLGEVRGELSAAEDSLRIFRERNRRITDSPELLITQERLRRSVELSSATFIELTRQYELARIDQVKNSTVVNVLDQARPPTRSSRPRRGLNTLLSVLITGVCLSVYYAGEGRHWRSRE